MAWTSSGAAVQVKSSLGERRSFEPASLLTWTHDGGVHVAERGRTRLALADYYLWWAHRLHSYAHEVSGSAYDLHLAERAARRGLRELGRLSKVVEHLDKHLAAEAEEEG